jgi:hypothetical protein
MVQDGGDFEEAADGIFPALMRPPFDVYVQVFDSNAAQDMAKFDTAGCTKIQQNIYCRVLKYCMLFG